MVERRFCKPQVGGSIPLPGLRQNFRRDKQQAVGSNPTSGSNKRVRRIAAIAPRCKRGVLTDYAGSSPAAPNYGDFHLAAGREPGKGVGKMGVFPWWKPACRQAGIETARFQGAVLAESR